MYMGLGRVINVLLCEEAVCLFYIYKVYVPGSCICYTFVICICNELNFFILVYIIICLQNFYSIFYQKFIYVVEIKING